MNVTINATFCTKQLCGKQVDQQVIFTPASRSSIGGERRFQSHADLLFHFEMYKGNVACGPHRFAGLKIQ
jgi:hypothetical protein